MVPRLLHPRALAHPLPAGPLVGLVAAGHRVDADLAGDLGLRLPAAVAPARPGQRCPSNSGAGASGGRTGAALAVHHRVALGHQRPPEVRPASSCPRWRRCGPHRSCVPCGSGGWSPAARWDGTPTSRSRSRRSESAAPAAPLTSTESSEKTRLRVDFEDSVEVLRSTTATCPGTVRVLARAVVSPATAPCPRAGRRRPAAPESVVR